MTALQKKTENPIAHLSAEDIEIIGKELDTIRQEVRDSLGADDAKYIRTVILSPAATDVLVQPISLSA